MNSWHIARPLKANCVNYSLLYDLRNDLVMSSYYVDINGRYIWAYREFESMFGHSVLVYEKHNIMKAYLEKTKDSLKCSQMIANFPSMEILRLMAPFRLWSTELLALTEYYPFPQSLLIVYLKKYSFYNTLVAWNSSLNPKPTLIAMKILASIHGKHLLEHKNYITNATGELAMKTYPMAFRAITNPTEKTTSLS